MLLTSGMKLHPAYVPSEYNPADEPSRGVLRRGRGKVAAQCGLAYPSRSSVCGAKWRRMKADGNETSLERTLAHWRRVGRLLRRAGHGLHEKNLHRFVGLRLQCLLKGATIRDVR